MQLQWRRRHNVQKIDFEYTTKYGVFRDALHLPEDQVFTDADIDAMKQQRLDNWIYHVENPPPPPPEPEPPEVFELTPEEKIAVLEARIEALKAQANTPAE